MGVFRGLDDLLRGRATTPALLKEGTAHLQAGALLAVAAALGVTYGLFMGFYAVINHEPRLYAQLLSSALKVPALFLLTLFVTFPSLYVFGALLGARLSLVATLRVFVAGIAVTLTLLASLGPIMGFFVLTTDNYPFIKLLNVAFFTAAAIIGLKFLSGLLNKLEEAEALRLREEEEKSVPVLQPDPLPAGGPPPLPVARPVDTKRDAKRLYSHGLLRVWMVLYIVVGAQMSWVLRPFIGAPDRPFEIFRERHANFFMDVLRTIQALLQ